MPDKGRRVAARQAKLSQRRKKQGRAPSGSPTVAPTSAAVEAQPDGRAAAQTQRPAPTPAAPPAARQVQASPARTPAQARTERPLTYSYIGTEFRRILILSGLALAIVIVLGFFLPVG